MALINTINIYQGEYGKYYLIDGYKYDIHFPIAWAIDHKINPDKLNKKTGPKECVNCFSHGSINNVFVHYCFYCMSVYNGERGGFIFKAIYESDENMWKYLPYMNGIKKTEIGTNYYNISSDISYISDISDDDDITVESLIISDNGSETDNEKWLEEEEQYFKKQEELLNKF